MSGGEPFQLFHHAEVPREALWTEERVEELDRAHFVRAGTPVVRAEVRLLGERARQETIGERSVCHDADAVLPAVREDVALHALVEQVPAVLGDVDAPHAHACLDLTPPEVRDADEAGFSLTDDVLEGAHGLLDGRDGVGPVDEVDVDAVGAEVLEALLDRLHAAGATRVAELRLVPISDAELGDDDRVPAPWAECPSERALGGAHPVALGGIEAGDAEVEGSSDGPGELRFVDLPVATTDLP